MAQYQIGSSHLEVKLGMDLQVVELRSLPPDTGVPEGMGPWDVGLLLGQPELWKFALIVWLQTYSHLVVSHVCCLLVASSKHMQHISIQWSAHVGICTLLLF